MATVVSHAMRRYPITPPDAEYSPYDFRTPSSSQSWKKPEETESSLSRSMRYAEPWLYGSVRAPSGLLFTPALVLCSCADYLNGTKRSSKKGQTICKKCKGTRIPLNAGLETSKFGTVRCYPTAPLQQTCVRAGTVKVCSKSRPSILNSAGDPYDLMRRSRLAVSDGAGQYRARSVSPNKKGLTEKSPSRGKSNSAQQTTIGRKSILECHVNPYELMGVDGEPADASITFVNGQRIRVRPKVQDVDYEDVQIRRQSSQRFSKHYQQQAFKSKNFSSVRVKSHAKDIECNGGSSSNRFKSILKKPTTTFNDTDPSSSERSPSPARKSGSHFYLPLPANGGTPRKKVQFLVENELVSREIRQSQQSPPTSPSSNDYETDDEVFVDARETFENYERCERRSDPKTTMGKESTRKDVVEEDEPNRERESTNSCNLRRTKSERMSQEAAKVLFHDTMALRLRSTRNDSREAFSSRDLEKLDGVKLSKLKNFEIKPRGPPPQPPSSPNTDSSPLKFHVPKLAPLASPEKLVIQESPEDLDAKKTQKDLSNIKEKSEDSEKELQKDVKNEDVDINALAQVNKILDADISKDFDPISPQLEDSVESDESDVAIPKKLSDVEDVPPEMKENRLSENENVAICANTNDLISFEPPAAPPRKRSNNRQLLMINVKNTNYVSYVTPVVVEETSNKTIVRISSPETAVPVHKLKIRNEFPENTLNSVTISDNNLGKTSIMINGDDCYSTVNVKDDVSIYQSSVVVKDSGVTVQTPERKSSSIYITGNFGISPDCNIQNDIAEEQSYKLYEDVSLEKDGDQTNRNAIPQIKADLIAEDQCSTTDMLKQILCDPVEAVRRNLVPHVCGRSDVPRRPRGRKMIKSDDLVASFLNDSLLNGNSLDSLQSDHVTQLIEDSFSKLRNHDNLNEDLGSEHSSTTQYEIMDAGSDCYTDNSNRSSVTEEELSARSKFYEMLAESAIEVAENEDHHYESIKANVDPIYEEIEVPPPLPANPPPAVLLDDLQLDKEYTTRSIFEGASKYDILSYLVDAKERGIVPEDSYTYNFGNSTVEDEAKENSESYNRVSHMSTVSDSSEDNSLTLSNALSEDKVQRSIEVERNDSGVGSETSKSSLSKYRTKQQEQTLTCEDCDGTIDLQGENEPLICRKCIKKRSERKEIITEIVETEEKYSRDLQIILEEFYQPMLVAGLLTSEQLSAIFVNVEELLENSQALAERLRDAVEIAMEQGDEDLLTVNIGKLILEAAPMLHAFETYCIRQGAASLLLASLEKEKELLRIFLRVSQMENTVLRRMNLNSFLMVPVQRVTKYPLLLARLYKVTPPHHETREQLKEAQHKIELHLNHMNSETKDVPSKLWRRISNNNGRRSSSEMDLVNIKLRKIAVDVLEWNHDEARFALEGKLLFTQPTDNNWRKGRTIKLAPVNALLVTNGKVTNTTTNRPDPAEDGLIFSRHSGVREAALLLVRDKNGRYSLLREPLYLDRCVIAADPAWQSYFEVQELLGKDTFIFKADDEEQTKIWYRHLQYYAQGMGAWRKRRNALANIMINGMGLRS